MILDPVLHLTPRKIQPLIQRLAFVLFRLEARHYQARILLAVNVLGLGEQGCGVDFA